MLGVVPAAGRARRLQPLEGSKEVLLVAGRPVMDHVIERMRIAGCDDVVVVTRPDKPDVLQRAARLGARTVVATPEDLCASILAGADAIDPDSVVLLGLPDTVWHPLDGYVALVGALRAPFDVALGLFDGDEPERSDVVTADHAGVVRAVAVKPAAPAARTIWGCAALRGRALEGMRSVAEPGHHWDRLARRGQVAGVRLAGPYLDIGTREALRRADARTGPA